MSSLTEVNTMAADVKGIIYGINGPVIYIKGKTAFRMGEWFMLDRRNW